MKKNFKLFKIGIFLALILGFALGQDAYGATVTWDGSTSTDWHDGTNWDTGNVPTAADDVVLPNLIANDPVLSADGECLTLTLAGDATLDATTAGVETLTVYGDITQAGTGLIGGVAAPNLVIGSLGSPVSSTITSAATGDFNLVDITVNDAAVTLVGTAGTEAFNVDGDITLLGASTITTGGTDLVVTINAGAGTQTLTVSDDSFVSFSDLTIGAGSTLATADDFTVITLIATGNLTQSAGTCYFNAATAADLQGAGTVQFNNLYINATGVPTSTASAVTVIGDLTKVGAGTFTFNNVGITFDNSTAAEMVLSGGAVTFKDITLAADSRVTTNSSFTIGDGTNGGTFTINSDASFNAGTGTITMNGLTAPVTLVNNGGQDTCLTFANFTVAATAGTVTTATDLVVTGDFTVGAAATFDATAGTVSFDNTVQKTLTNSGAAATFCNLDIADGASVTSASNIGISDNAAAVASGISVGTGSTLTFTTPSVVTIGSEAQEATSNSTIVNNGTLEFFALTIGDFANNNVVTSDDFVIQQNLTATSTGAQSNFTASSPSVITFDNTGAHVIANATAITDLILHDIVVDGSSLTLTAAHFLAVNGDITVNGTGAGTFVAGDNAATVLFSGTEQQNLGGTSDQTNPFTFGILQVNKTAGTYPEDYVSLGTDAIFLTGGALTLTDGVLDLGTGNNLQLTAVTVTAPGGYINGNTGTITIAETGITWTAPLADALFTPDVPTGTAASLYNLTLGDNATGGDNETLGGNLTINGDIELLGGDLTLGTYTLTLKGNLTQTTLAEKITIGTGTIQLEGTGTVSNLSNTLFTGSAAPNMIFKRAETLAGDLTFTNTDLTMNCGTQTLDLGANTLTFTGTGNPIIVSGQMDAGTATVVFPAAITEIPANIFLNDEVDDITIAADVTLLGNLIVNSDFQGVFDVTTGDNYLELASGATDDFTNAAHVIGNLRKTVTGATATTFPIGGGNANDFRPVEILFATSTTSQKVEVSSEWASPVAGRAGDPSECINAVWTINPIGTVTNTFDSLQVNFGWGTDLDNGGLTVDDNQGFSARWDGSAWEDFRNSHVTGAGAVGTPASADGITMTTYAAYPLSSTDFGGTWAVFDPASAVEADKDAAIALADYKLVFTTQPTTVETAIPFNVVLQLQDQYGNPVTTTSALTVTIAIDEQPTATYTGPANAVIAANTNSVTVNGLILNTAGTEDVQLRASTTYNSATIYGTCDPIDILQAQPAAQGSMLTLSNTDYTSMTVAFTGTGTGGDRAIVVAKAGSAITSDDFPVDGTSYIGNSVFGAGSLIGDAVVIFDGPAGAENPTFSLEGLAPGTTYYLRIFSYLGSNGTENYNTNPGALSTRSASTTSETDDDVAFGANDTRATAKPIGANSAVSGTIADATDEDWFSFMVTSAASNVRVKLTGVPADYNLELYNADNRRVRRATLSGTESEYVVINNLDAGTYSIRIYGVDGAYSATAYTVEVQTRDTEIFSVTQ